MPKEIVEDMYVDVPNVVRVGWKKNSDDVPGAAAGSSKYNYPAGAGYVQIASIAPDGIALDTSGVPHSNGWFVCLDREGINRLIRILRQARDDAYGKDA